LKAKSRVDHREGKEKNRAFLWRIGSPGGKKEYGMLENWDRNSDQKIGNWKEEGESSRWGVSSKAIRKEKDNIEKSLLKSGGKVRVMCNLA